MTFTPITHQFSLFEYEQLRPRTRIKIKRISKERMMEVMMMRSAGNDRPLLEVLRGMNDDLERYEKQLKN